MMTQEEIDRSEKHEDLRIKEVLAGRNYCTAEEKQRYRVIDALAQQALHLSEVEDSDYRRMRDDDHYRKGFHAGMIVTSLAVIATCIVSYLISEFMSA